jgi:hypothetical protein
MSDVGDVIDMAKNALIILDDTTLLTFENDLKEQRIELQIFLASLYEAV